MCIMPMKHINTNPQHALFLMTNRQSIHPTIAVVSLSHPSSTHHDTAVNERRVVVSSNNTPMMTTAPNGYERLIGYWSGKSIKWSAVVAWISTIEDGAESIRCCGI